MANNRMYLAHKPTGLGVILGKRMGYGWYGAPEKELLNRFYEHLASHMEGDQDEFVLLQEADAGWDYVGTTEEGFMRLRLD